MTADGIRTVAVKRDERGKPTHVRLVFGPHYFVELELKSDGRVAFSLGATHHGFQVDASQINGELERLIEEVRRAHPEHKID